jgi:hypothetical protein
VVVVVVVIIIIIIIIKVKLSLSMQCRHMGGAEVNITPWPLYHQERIPVPIVWNSEWTPEIFWMFWRREKSLVPTGIQTPGCPAHSLVCAPITVSPSDDD